MTVASVEERGTWAGEWKIGYFYENDVEEIICIQLMAGEGQKGCSPLHSATLVCTQVGDCLGLKQVHK
jgi:hypothetical protein